MIEEATTELMDVASAVRKFMEVTRTSIAEVVAETRAASSLRRESESGTVPDVAPPVPDRLSERSRWRTYLDCLPGYGYNPKQVALARGFWMAIENRLGSSFPLPIAGARNTGALGFEWNPPSRYLEVEFFPDGSVEWFYKDDETGAADGTEEDRDEYVPMVVFERLRNFASR